MRHEGTPGKDMSTWTHTFECSCPLYKVGDLDLILQVPEHEEYFGSDFFFLIIGQKAVLGRGSPCQNFQFFLNTVILGVWRGQKYQCLSLPYLYLLRFVPPDKDTSTWPPSLESVPALPFVGYICEKFGENYMSFDQMAGSLPHGPFKGIPGINSFDDLCGMGAPLVKK